MNNQRQFRQLQNMDYRTPRQEQRMQFLARQQGQQMPQYRQQQPMPESAYGQLPAYRPNNVDYGKLLGDMGGQAMGGAAMGAGFQGAPMPSGMVNSPGQFQQQVDGLGQSPMQQMPFQGNPTGGVAQAAPGAFNDMRGQMTPQELQDLRGAYSEDPMAMPRGGMERQPPSDWRPQQQMAPGIANPISKPAAAPAPAYGISNPISRPQARAQMPRHPGIQDGIARRGRDRVKGLLATKPPQV